MDGSHSTRSTLARAFSLPFGKSIVCYNRLTQRWPRFFCPMPYVILCPEDGSSAPVHFLSMTLRISLLGPTQITRDAEQLALPGQRPLALLAYLLITGTPQRREQLVDLLFERPDDPRAALRWTLSQIRKTVGANTIISDRTTIAFNFQLEYWLDVFAFEAGELDCYRGELLEGLYLRDALQYEAWLLIERERLRAQFQTGLERRLQQAQESGDFAAAEGTALRLLQLDNAREDWHQTLMSAYAGQGMFEAALAQYELCCQILRDELGSEPARETVALAELIREQRAELYRVVAAHPPLVLLPDGSAEQPSLPSPGPIDKMTGASDRVQTHPNRNRSLNTIRGRAFAAVLVLVFVIWLVYYYSQEATRDAGATDNPQSLSPAAVELSGTNVTIMGPFQTRYQELFEESLSAFEAETGIDVELGAYPVDFEQVVPSVIASGLAPDIIMFPQPGLLAQFVRQGDVVDVRTFLDDAFLRQQYSDALLNAAMIEGQMAGIWHTTNVKSLVWYPKQAFDTAGYAVPQTWENLIALSDQIVRDGGIPWCIGMASGYATGWVGTDWVEDILLRTAPLQAYDAWTAGDLAFDSPEIRRAFALTQAIWFDERYVNGGRSAILADRFYESAQHLFEDPPGCFLHRQGSFIIAYFPEDAVYGRDYDFFYLPPIDAAYGRPMLGGGDIMAMFNDRPEVREVMRYLATGDSVKYLVAEAGVISPHRDVPFEWYSDPVALKTAQLLFEADAFRFDGSDLMPAEVGTAAFWQGMVDWVEGEDLDAVLRAIDDSWPDVE